MLWKTVSKLAEEPGTREMIIKYNRMDLSREMSRLNSKRNYFITLIRLWTCCSRGIVVPPQKHAFKQHFSEIIMQKF